MLKTPRRRRRLRQGARPLLRPPRRRRRHDRGLAGGVRGRHGPRPAAVQPLVHPGRHPAPAASTDDFKDGTYTLHFKQETPPTPGQPDKQPQVIPIAVGLLGHNGDEVVPTTVLEMTQGRAELHASRTSARKPDPSLLRGFSAPVILTAKPAPRNAPSCWPTTPTRSTSGRPGAPWPRTC